MDYKKLVDRTFLLISSPAKAWEEISVEEDKQAVMNGYVYPMMGLCGIALFLGSLSLDFSAFAWQTVMTKIGSLLISMFCGFFLAAKLVEACGAKLLKREQEPEQCRQLVGYAMSLSFVLAIIQGLFPGFFFLRWILQFYTVWIVWEGAQRFIKVGEEKQLSYTLLVSAIIIFSPYLLKIVFDYLSVTLN